MSMFPQTRWSVVIKAQGADGASAQHALEELCQSYWHPLYVFARRSGLSPEDAEDRTQAFFHQLLRNKGIEAVDRERGRLRAFLLVSMKNSLRQEMRNQQAEKRGGHHVHIPMDAAWAEEQFLKSSCSSDESPEALFDRSWAYALLKTVFKRLEAYHDQAGTRPRYEAIKGCLQGDGSYEVGEKLSADLGITPATLRTSVFKLRRRFRDYVEDEIRHTCATEEEAREEIVHLCRILATH